MAVSGGADSVAMLRALLNISPNHSMLEVAHFNHQWRGAESDGDERFVRNLCHQHQIRFHVGQPAANDSESTQSEATARELRYRFLTSTAYRTGARYVATAHNADDRVETMLHNLFRGTGLAGAVGPARTRELDEQLVIVRPLLGCRRKEILNYLNQIDQSFREDSSNRDEGYRRNYLRHNLLPQLREQYDSGIDERILNFCDIAQETQAVLLELAKEYLQRVEKHELCQPDDNISGIARRFYLPSNAAIPTRWPIVFQALQLVWHQRGWPLQQMASRHWGKVRAFHLSTEELLSPIELPGRLRLSKPRQQVVAIEAF